MSSRICAGSTRGSTGTAARAGGEPATRAASRSARACSRRRALRPRSECSKKWLGHVNPSTTHAYVEADLAMKERTLQKLAPTSARARRFRADDRLLAFLGNNASRQCGGLPRFVLGCSLL